MGCYLRKIIGDGFFGVVRWEDLSPPPGRRDREREREIPMGFLFGGFFFSNFEWGTKMALVRCGTMNKVVVAGNILRKNFFCGVRSGLDDFT